MTQGFGYITCCGSWSHATDLFYFFPPDGWLARFEMVDLGFVIFSATDFLFTVYPVPQLSEFEGWIGKTLLLLLMFAPTGLGTKVCSPV